MYEKISISLEQSKYADDALFDSCISFACPAGYLNLLDQVINEIKAFTKQYNTKINIQQVKSKFGLLCVYFAPNENIKDTPIIIAYDLLVSKTDKICVKSKKMCKVCGKKTVTIVYNNSVVEKCFIHFEVNQ